MGLSKQAKEDMEFLGDFAPCADARSFKGYMLDNDGGLTTVYLHESDFRNLAKSCLEAAEYLASKRQP